MKLAKAIVYFLSMTLGSLLIAAVFAPSEHTIQREVEIKAQKKLVYNVLLDMRKWSRWDAWYAMDSLQTRSFEGSKSRLPYSFTWRSKNEQLGNGTLSITAVSPNEQVGYQTTLENGRWDIHLTGNIKVEDYHGACKVTWSATSKMSYPFKFMHYFMEKMAAKDYETSLEGLKVYTEALSRASFFDQTTSP